MKKMIKFSCIILSIISLMMVSGCSNNAGLTGGALTKVIETGDLKEVEIEMFNFGFKQTGDNMVAGDTVKLTVKSTSGTHGINIPELGIRVDPLRAGETKTIEFVATKSGSFDYYCNIMCGPGHMDMKSKLVIN